MISETVTGTVTETVTVNGEARDYRRQTIAEMLTEYGLDPTRPGIAVAINGTVARRADWPARRLAVDDRIEIVQAKAGG